MGWLPWSSTDSSSSDSDPIKGLDPELRKFLEREAPKAQASHTERDVSYRRELASIGKSKTGSQTPTPPTSSTDSDSINSKSSSSTTTTTTTTASKAVPAESLFPDGRYAHLWTTYTPLSTIEAATKTDQDRLRDLVDSFEQRKRAIGRAALENCAFEALAQSKCMRGGGGFASTLTMCRAETRALNRCTDMQAKFLTALGYTGSNSGAAAAAAAAAAAGGARQSISEDQERIQMHADGLFQQMLAHEEERRKAKEEGRPVPEFKPVMSAENLVRMLGSDSAAATAVSAAAAAAASRKSSTPTAEDDDLSHVPEKLREEFKKNIKDKTTEERAVEEAALFGDIEVRKRLAEQAAKIMQDDKRKRLKRWEEGNPTIGDRMKRWWGGWDD